MLSTFKSVLARPGAQAAIHNFGWLVGEKMTRLLLNVCIGFLIARYLGPADFGVLSYATAVVGIGVVLAEMGLSAVVIRELISAPQKGAGLLAATIRLRLIAGILCYGAVLAWVRWGADSRDERVLLVALGLLLFQPALAVADLWLQAHLQARLAVRAQLAGMTMSALIRIGLVVGQAPLIAFAVAPLFEAVMVVTLLNLFARRTGRPRPAADNTGSQERRLWTEAWPLLLSGLTVMIYMRVDLVMLRHMAGERAAGEYAAAVRLSEVWFFLPVALSASMLPGLLAARKEGPVAYAIAFQRFFDWNAIQAYLFTVPMVLLAPWIVGAAYGTMFVEAGPVLVVHGWTLLWASLGVARGQYCVNEGHMRFQLIATTAGAGLNIGLNFWLIPRHGAVGAAWATLAAQAVAAWLSSFCFVPLQACAVMQTRALFVPLRSLTRVLQK